MRDGTWRSQSRDYILSTAAQQGGNISCCRMGALCHPCESGMKEVEPEGKGGGGGRRRRRRRRGDEEIVIAWQSLRIE